MEKVYVKFPRDVAYRFRQECGKGERNHFWEEIYEDRPGSFWTERIVIRWCSVCGSVVINREVDYQFKSNVMSVKSPQIATEMSWDGKG